MRTPRCPQCSDHRVQGLFSDWICGNCSHKWPREETLEKEATLDDIRLIANLVYRLGPVDHLIREAIGNPVMVKFFNDFRTYQNAVNDLLDRDLEKRGITKEQLLKGEYDGSQS